MLRNRTPWSLLFITTVSACSSIESSNVRTDGIYAELGLAANGSGSTEVTAALRAGGSTGSYLDLAKGDRLVAYSDGESREMELDSSLFGTRVYAATFSRDSMGSEFRVEFVRQASDSEEESCRGGGAPSSRASLPSPFSIQSPSVDARISRASELVVRWARDERGDSMEGEIRGDCIQLHVLDMSGDRGEVRIAANEIEPLMASESCTATLELRRIRQGTNIL